MSGSLSLIIILIVVVWAIVLAPMVLGDSKPIRRSGEGYDETRVLHQGGTSALQARRRPKVTKADVHRHSEDEDFEVVEATHDELDDVLIDDADTPSWKKFFSRGDADSATKGGSTALSTLEDAETEAETDSVDGEVIDDEAVVAAADAEDAADQTADETQNEDIPAGSSVRVDLGSADSAEGDDPDADADAAAADDADHYDVDDSYLSPADYGYVSNDVVSMPASEDEGGNEDVVLDEDDSAAVIDAVDDETAVESEAPAEAGAGVEAATSRSRKLVRARGGSTAVSEFEPTEDELAFARSRRGRGGWDPEAEKRYREDRFRRRQRTLLGLVVLAAVTFVFAIVSGGWAWLAPALSVGLLIWYMTALRTTVKQERALHARRVRQLRRARLGVVSSEETAPVPEQLRRPGAVIVEVDDESADFANLPSYTSPRQRPDGELDGSVGGPSLRRAREIARTA